MNTSHLHKLLTLLIICNFLVVSYPTGSTTKPEKNIPEIARILNVDVGRSTMPDLEKILGEGASCMGGHPYYGRAWYLSRQKLYIYADGFDYDKNGKLIINTIELGTHMQDLDIDFCNQQPKPVIPHVSISNRKIGWVGKVIPGQSSSIVSKHIKGLPKPVKNGDTLRWTMKGKYSTIVGVERRSWDATLTFEKSRLTTIDVHIL
jgi:hypothetical protein